MKESTKWITVWLEQHPAHPRIGEDGRVIADDSIAPLFPLSQEAIRSLLRRIGTRALGKRVYPHLLRHSSATYWCNRLAYFKFCKRFGWSMTSKMPQRYIDVEGVDELEGMDDYLRRDHSSSNLHTSSRHGPDLFSDVD